MRPAWDDICMLRTSRAAASQLGLSRREVNRAVRSGRIVSARIGDRNVVSDRAVVAASRTAGRGRRWSPLTARAALELLESGNTDLVRGSERSRLKARLRAAGARELGYQLLAGRVSLWRRTSATGARVESALAASLGLAADGGLAVDVAADVGRRARELRLVEDSEGDVLLVEGDERARRVLEAVGLYAFGSTRESGAAEAWLRERIEAL
jgi:hypothetical protein